MGLKRATRAKQTAQDSDGDGDTVTPAHAKPAGRASKALRQQTRESRPSRSINATLKVVEPSSDDNHSGEPQSSIVLNSDSKRLDTRPQHKAKATPSTTKSPSASPAKKGGSRNNAPETKPSKTIYSFFNAATQRQQSQGSGTAEKRTSVAPTADGDEEDLISDGSLDEDLAAQADFAVPHRKRKLEEDPKSSSSFLQSSQKFLKTTNGRTASGSQIPTIDARTADTKPWIERYGPDNVEELAVHKKKIADVREWLISALEGRDRKRLLLVKGAAGTGKTCAVKLLVEQLGVRIREWHNPEIQQNSSDGSGTVASQFQDFIGNSGKFGSLDLFSHDQSTNTAPPKGEGEVDDRQITIIEELPNTFIHSSSGLDAFRSCILQYLAASTPSMDTLFSDQQNVTHAAPVVIIYSETLLNTSTASIDSLTAHKLLGAEIMTHPGASIIEFNPVAPTILTKALEVVIRKEARHSGRRRAPGPAVLKHLSEIGDVRSAVSALEFICLRGDDASSWSGRVAATSAAKTRKSGTNDSATLTEFERRSLELVTQRESALDIFHAVGKVVYNKREVPVATDTPPPQPPPYFTQYVRTKVPEVDANELLDELGTDVQTFISTLHENYILSCATSESEKTLDCINGSIDALSDADLLCSDNLGTTGLFRRNFRGISADVLRQEESSYHVATRGLLFSLPYPVKRIAPPAPVQPSAARATNAGQQFGGKGDAYRMFYPTSFKLWRQREEIEGLLTLLLSKAQKGELRNITDLTGMHRNSKSGGVESWKSSSASRFITSSEKTQSKPTASEQTSSQTKHDESSSQALMGGTSARRELLLEQLPYITFISGKPSSNTMPSSLLQQIERVTHMAGLAVPADDAEDEDDVTAEEAVSKAKPLVLRTRKKEEGLGGTVAGNAAQGLILSDDDIEDD